MTDKRTVSVYYLDGESDGTFLDSVRLEQGEIDGAIERLVDKYYRAGIVRLPGTKGPTYIYLASEGVFQILPTVYCPEDKSKQKKMIAIQSLTREGCDRIADELGLPRAQRQAEGLVAKVTEAKK